jgi:transketolase
MNNEKENLKKLATTIRVLSAEGVDRANSGHPGMPLGSADYATVLWAKHLNFNPKDTNWLNRDRFVLSAGHGSMLIYSLLHVFGYAVTRNDLMNFRQWESITPGHPEYGVTAGVETTTGPLGQGFANGLGLALNYKILAEKYNQKLFNGKVFGIVSDGDLMEGVASEAASLAGHLGLNNLIYLYDDNHISIGGNTNVCFTENVKKRFEAYNWNVLEIDGHDQTAADQALDSAKKETERPTIICARTTIGFGSPKKANTADVHGSPLGKEELANTKKQLGWNHSEEFFVPEEVSKYVANCLENKIRVYDAWQNDFSNWKKENTDKASQLEKQINREIPKELREELIATFNEVKKGATRALSGKAIQVIANKVEGFIGGSADLEPSTKTLINNSTDITAKSFSGKNIRFGVREHAMGALANGLAYTKNFIPYTATFLVFSDYMRPSVRLAALSHLQTLFIFTHDSFWVGEDGPTHQPVEHLMSLRIIPNLYVFRPADGLETGLAYWSALNLKNRPSALLFTRQDLPTIDRGQNFDTHNVEKGGYIVSGKENNSLVLVASGSEVWVAVEAAKLLAEKGVKARVVSMPCVELFNEQTDKYKEEVIPNNAKKVVIEAGISLGWQAIVGKDALFICQDTYGASAPGELLAEKFGFTLQQVVSKINTWL